MAWKETHNEMTLTTKPWMGGTFALLLAMPPLAAQVSDAVWGPGEIRPPIQIVITPFAGPTGYTPSQLRTAYGFTAVANQGQGQTIAIVDAFDHPNIEADLGAFNAQFGLPACTTANGCFQKVYAAGTKPPTNTGWAVEIALDVEWAHAIAPQAKILLVEAASNANAPMYQAVDVAVQQGARVVSMSWGGSDGPSDLVNDAHFNVTGVTFVASSGDSGHGVSYPASSPYVVGVGGTTLYINAQGTYLFEVAWNGSGGGTSNFETEPSYQAGVQQTGKRGIPDVAYDANPSTGVPVYTTIGASGWIQVGGTSMGAPQIAALFGIVNSARAGSGKSTLNQVNFNLYPLASDFHDVKYGKNGSCGAQCRAVAGYDFVTGLGTPKAHLLIPALVALP